MEGEFRGGGEVRREWGEEGLNLRFVEDGKGLVNI